MLEGDIVERIMHLTATKKNTRSSIFERTVVALLVDLQKNSAVWKSRENIQSESAGTGKITSTVNALPEVQFDICKKKNAM